MFNLLQLHALAEERIRRGGPEWNLEHATALSVSDSKFHFFLDLQIGPIFITIGSKAS
jgi:hypothetical protein